MNVEQIRKRVHEDPTPFVIRLTDGRKFSIPHQDYIAIGKQLVIVIAEDDASVKIDPLHIVSLDDVRAKKTGKR
jgi:uncharacterized protein YrrD